MSESSGSARREVGPLSLYVISVGIGIVGALGACAFRGLIAVFHNLFFLGEFSSVYDTNLHTPASPWGPWIILAPVLGAAGVAFLVGNFAPEAKGHGVPEVMDAIYYHKGVIRPIVALIKSLASALSIGTGGSVGREGPIIQIGSSFGSTLGQVLRLPSWQRITMIAAGGGAGIAATFNTPIGGVLFAVEIMLHEVSARTLVPVTIATVTSSYVGRLIFGNHPSFVIPPLKTSVLTHTDPFVLLLYPGLGLLAGLLSLIYIRSVYAVEDAFESRLPGSYYVRHMLGMLCVGLMMYGLFRWTGHYYVEGVGYATIQDVLSGSVSWFLLVLCALKLAATSLTLGSGASGGIFSPALFMGATLGGVYGMAWNRLFPGLGIDPVAFAVSGMAAMVGGATGAALTAIVMIFEMTQQYSDIIPITLTVSISYGVRKVLLRESIYTLKLARRGHVIPDSLQANFYHLKKIREVMETHFATLQTGAAPEDLARLAAERPDIEYFLLEGPDGIVGFQTRGRALPAAQPPVALADLVDRRIVEVGENTPLFELMSRLRAAGGGIGLVVSEDVGKPGLRVCGVVGGEQIAAAAIGGLELFSGDGGQP